MGRHSCHPLTGGERVRHIPAGLKVPLSTAGGREIDLPWRAEMVWTKERARVAALTRGVRAGERTQAELDEARRAFRAARVEEYVDRIVEDWPTLSDEQLERIAALLRAGR